MLLRAVQLASALGVLATGIGSLSADAVPSFAVARYPTGGFSSSVAIGDVNGDARPDLIVPNYAGHVGVWLNRGKGLFGMELIYPSSDASAVAVGDLNGDGQLDVATANWNKTGTASVLLNVGDGVLVQTDHDLLTGSGPLAVAIADVDADGYRDIVTANNGFDRRGHTVSVLLGHGDGTFEPKRDYRTGVNPCSVVIGDLNGDGALDLATADAGGNTVSVLLGSGNGRFGAARSYPTGRVPRGVAIGDLNSDGKLDLATADSVSHTVSVFLNSGNGRFVRNGGYRTGRVPVAVAIGDLSGDGAADVVTANERSSVSLLLNAGTGRLQSSLDYLSRRPDRDSPGPMSVALADLNGDGKSDIAITSGNPESIAVLLAGRASVCVVPRVVGRTLGEARRLLRRAGCRVWHISRRYAQAGASGRVISQQPGPRAVLRTGGKVDVVVSLGRRR